MPASESFEMLLDELRKIGLPPDDFAVFGSGPLAARGLRDPHDLDLVARGDAWDICKAKGKPHETASGDESYEFFDGDIEVAHGWFPGEWDTDEIIDTADIIDGIRFARLELVLEWKRRMGREKDLNDIGLIEGYVSRQDRAASPYQI